MAAPIVEVFWIENIRVNILPECMRVSCTFSTLVPRYLVNIFSYGKCWSSAGFLVAWDVL